MCVRVYEHGWVRGSHQASLVREHFSQPEVGVTDLPCSHLPRTWPETTDEDQEGGRPGAVELLGVMGLPGLRTAVSVTAGLHGNF